MSSTIYAAYAKSEAVEHLLATVVSMRDSEIDYLKVGRLVFREYMSSYIAMKIGNTVYWLVHQHIH